jgi:hypothetical protein
MTSRTGYRCHPRTFPDRGEAEAFRDALSSTPPELSRTGIMIPRRVESDKANCRRATRILCIINQALHNGRTPHPHTYPHACRVPKVMR